MKDNVYISSEDIVQYLGRLCKNRKQGKFISQYLEGDGNEISKKFWSVKSSSRLAFDLYSWIDGVSFEKKLPGIICRKSSTGKKSTAGVPNMDVCFNLNNTTIYIESKYTESSNWVFKTGEKPLSKAYWDNDATDIYKMDIAERFYGMKSIADKFSEFCNTIDDVIEIQKTNNRYLHREWFDPKQETCHLFGIILDLLNAQINNGIASCETDPSNVTKKIHFLNIVYNMKDDIIHGEGGEDLPTIFRREALNMMRVIGLGDNFSYDFMRVQELFEDNSCLDINFKDRPVFGMKDITIQQQIWQYSWAEALERRKAHGLRTR